MDQGSYLASLGRLAGKLHISNSYQDVVSHARDEVEQCIGFSNVWIYLNEHGDSARANLLACAGDKQSLLRDCFSSLELENDPFMQSLSKCEGLDYVQDTYQDARVNQDLVSAVGIRTVVNCPIRLHSENIGIIGTGSFDEEGVVPLNETQMDYLRAMSSMVAVNIDRLRLIEISCFDPLTGLHNRRSMLDRSRMYLEYSQRQGLPLGVLFIDLDDFKSVNDAYGHHVGDKFLVEFANRLRANVRPDDMVVRVGGDEFVVILGELANERELEKVADALAERCSGQLTIAGFTLDCRFSVGMAAFPMDGNTVLELITVADQRMYFDKRDRRHAV